MFVHARNATVKTAMSLRDLATNYGDLSYFQPEQSPRLGQAEKQVCLISYVFMCARMLLYIIQCNSSSNRSPYRIQCNNNSNRSPYRIQCNNSSNRSPYRIQCNSSSNRSPYRIQCNSSSNRSPYRIQCNSSSNRSPYRIWCNTF